MKWTGQWPSFEVVLKFKYLNSGKTGNDNAMVTSVRFSTCRKCYKAAKVIGYRKRDSKYDSRGVYSVLITTVGVTTTGTCTGF